MEFDYDLVVIGSGPAGEKGAVQAAYFGKRVAVIERAPQPGGASVHTGTLPSKTLRETALFLAGHRQRALYGVSLDVEPDIAVQRMIARKDTIRAAEVERIHWNLDRHGVELIRGSARFLDAHRVEVAMADERRELSARFILVATGSRPHRPADIDFSHPRIDDSDSILHIETLPRRMAVVGGGVIGCEYTAMFAELGVEVILVDTRPGILPFLDSDVTAVLIESFREAGVQVHLSARVTSVVTSDEHVAITLGSGEQVIVDRLLYAAGRSGATAGLDLEAAGVAVTERGHIRVDHEFRTTAPSVLAAGDIVGFPGLASVSMEQGRVAVCHAFGFDYKQDVSSLLPYGIFTIPEVSSVGLSEDAARQDGREVAIGRANYNQNARGRIVGATQGMVKLVFDQATRKLLGVHMVGDQATELVHIGQAIIGLGGTVETLIDMVFNYPTLAEAYKYAAYDALARLNATPRAESPAAGEPAPAA
jgi:NAD(P) transhydrogenase